MKNVLLTGGNGFLGQHIYAFLNNSGYKVLNLGRNRKNDIVANLATEIPGINIPIDLVIHAAGKAHIVPKTDAEKKDFFDVNVEGTSNLLKGLEASGTLPRAFVFISTVAVYGLDEGENIAESYPLNGSTPYAQSKIDAEKLLNEWCTRNNVVLSVLRLPLIAGKNPPGNLGDMIKAISGGKYLNIAGGLAKKSVVMAEDVASHIVKIAAVGGTYNLSDRYHPNFKEISNVIATQLGKKTPASLPKFAATLIGKVGDLLGSKAPVNTSKIQKMIAPLTFNDDKAVQAFNWQPRKVLDSFIIK